VATTAYVADDLADAVQGRVSSSAPGQSLRDATIDWIRTHGLARGPAGAGDRSA